MIIKKIRLRLLFSAVFLIAISPLSAQELAQVWYAPLNGMAINADSKPGHAMGFNVLYKKFGIEFEYGKTRSSREQWFKYFHPELKYCFMAKDGNEKSKYQYISAGVLFFKANKDDAFYGRGENLQPPYWRQEDITQTYNEYHVNGIMRSTAFQVGYEKCVEKHIEVPGGWFKVLLLNPFGLVIGSVMVYDDDKARFDFTRTFKAGLLFSTAGLTSFEKTSAVPSGGEYLTPQFPKENVIMKPVRKNLVGFRLGIEWKTLKPVGLVFGIDAGMVPGVFTTPGVYGRNFPDDNIYFKAKWGFVIGYSTKTDL